MKSFKKVMAFLLALVMVMSMVACGSDKKDDNKDDANKPADGTVTDGGESTDDTDGDGYTVLKDANGNVYDLGGMEIILGDWWTPDEVKEPKNAYDEARRDYLNFVQETYNFKIKQCAISSWGDMPTDFVNFATSGGPENYVFIMRQGGELISAVQNGLMYDLSTLDCLDFSEAKWDKTVEKIGTVGTARYLMRGEEHEPTTGVYFNKRLLKEAGVDPQSIYDMQANNTWTWEAFEGVLEKIKADTDGDGVIDRFAMTNFTSGNLFPAAIWSNGGSVIEQDADGKFYNNFESDATLEAMNWAMELVDKYEMIYPADAAWDYTYSAFRNGEAAFTSGRAYQAGQDYKDMEDDFGFVCFPMGPRMDHYCNLATDNCFAIPACYDADRAWKIAFAYNLWSDPVPGFEDYSPMSQGYYNSMRDAESVEETIALLIKSPVADLTGCVAGIDLGPQMYWAINKENTPAAQAEAMRDTWQSFIDTANGVQ
jgi:ABC-type glycerol-3-phosphate transport system substrate-binding protein